MTDKVSTAEPVLPTTGRRDSVARSRTSANRSARQSGRLATDSIGYYLSSIGRVPLLTAAEEIELAHHVQAMKELLEVAEEERTPRQRHRIRMGKRARDRMMAANLRLVVSVAKKYQNQGLELLDLVQEGAIGLERAVDKLDPAMGYKFSTYAYWWIRQGMTGPSTTAPAPFACRFTSVKSCRRCAASPVSYRIVSVDNPIVWSWRARWESNRATSRISLLRVRPAPHSMPMRVAKKIAAPSAN